MHLNPLSILPPYTHDDVVLVNANTLSPVRSILSAKVSVTVFILLKYALLYTFVFQSNKMSDFFTEQQLAPVENHPNDMQDHQLSPPPPVQGAAHPRPPPPVQGAAHPRPPTPVQGAAHPRPPTPVQESAHPRPPTPVQGAAHPRPPPPTMGALPAFNGIQPLGQVGPIQVKGELLFLP